MHKKSFRNVGADFELVIQIGQIEVEVFLKKDDVFTVTIGDGDVVTFLTKNKDGGADFAIEEVAA